MRFYLVMHDLPLINHQILYIQRRRKQFTTRPIMIELPARQRKNRHTQLVQLLIDNLRIFTQSQTKFRIHIIERKFTLLIRTFHQKFYRPVAQQPNADIHQEIMRFHQRPQFFYRWFLKHVIQLVRCRPRRDKYTMVLCKTRIHPQAITHHVRFRDLLQRLARTDIHIPTGNQRMQGIRRFLHNLLIQRQLQRKEILRQSLATRPTENRNRCQHLTRRCIPRQSTALTTRMQQDTLLLRQPFTQRQFRCPFPATSIQKPSRTSSGTQLAAHRIGCTEPL